MTDTITPEQALKNLIRGYVNLLETGRDRIIAAGGYCDPVDKMEASDPYLREARAALAQQPDCATNGVCVKSGLYCPTAQQAEQVQDSRSDERKRLDRLLEMTKEAEAFGERFSAYQNKKKAERAAAPKVAQPEQGERSKLIADAREHAESLRVVMQDQAAETIDCLCDELQSAQPAQQAEQAEQGWQPIETAPKDGKEVLLGEPDGSITVAYWNERKEEFTTDGGYSAPWATHWMPLPAAPKGGVA